MSRHRARVERTIRSFLSHRQAEPASFQLDTALNKTGLGLSSFETAQLFVHLEDELGQEPFREGEIPRTVGEIVEFYDQGERDEGG